MNERSVVMGADAKNRRSLLRAFLIAPAMLACPRLVFSQSPMLGTVVCVRPADTEQFRKQFGDSHERIRKSFAAQKLIDGRDIALKFVEDKAGKAEAIAERLVAMKPAAILMLANMDLLQALRKRTSDIPIVFYAFGRDPARAGLVESIHRPGGNITGTTFHTEELEPKMFELLKETAPAVKRVGVLWPKELYESRLADALRGGPQATGRKMWDETKEVVRSRIGLDIVEIPIAQDVSINGIEAAVGRRKVDALFIGMALTPTLIQFIGRSPLPTLGMTFNAVRRGVLVGTTLDWGEGEDYAVSIVNRILHGESPATIPVHRSTRFFVAVNKTTARRIGLEIPASVLIKSDAVFE